MDQAVRREVPFDAARGIHEAFQKYNENFWRITRRARARFEACDWRGAERDLGERLELYTKSVDRTVAALKRQLGDAAADRQLWRRIKDIFGDRVGGIPDGAFCKTFFNSVSRRIFQTVGTDPGTEFLDIGPEFHDGERYAVEHRCYLNWGALTPRIEQLLTDFAFDAGYVDVARDVARIEAELARYAMAAGLGDAEVLRLDFLPAVFYQSTHAYLIGQVFWPGHRAPLIIELGHGEDGVAVEGILMQEDEISILFGFTRSYFFVDIEPVEGAVHFIRSILPHKPIDELYTVLGRVRQGKTERYRMFSSHLATCMDRFVHAPGDRGLVMICFTLPSYDLVFKVIRDRFGFPKRSNRAEVMAKYQFVFKHDRAGRLIDTQEFTHIGLPRAKFEPAVLDELLQEAAETARIEGDQVVIQHLYVERRLRPLNLYLQECGEAEGRVAVVDYGQAIKDLAEANIFPGDLLLKNFGVTRHGRIIFYDYDELCLVTDCNFRELPESPFEEDAFRPQPWFHVNENDIFPAEFIRFLAMPTSLRELFLERHGDLLTVAYWRGVQERLNAVRAIEPPRPMRAGAGSRTPRAYVVRG